MAKDTMQPIDSSTNVKTEVLTEVELFHRFMDAPIRYGAASTLIAPPEAREQTIQEDCLESFYPTSNCFNYDLSEQIIEALRASEDPVGNLGSAISDLDDLVSNLRELRAEFVFLRNVTRAEQPGHGASDEELDDWDSNPRYILPLIQ